MKTKIYKSPFMFFYLFIFLVFSFYFIKAKNIEGDDLELNSRIDVVYPNQILKDKGYAVWGGSTILGDDGKYYMFYSRWKGAGLGGWSTTSTIACAVSDSPYGPFKHVKVILNGGSGDENRWDYINAHNPHIKKFGDFYYLYYISSYKWQGKVSATGRKRSRYDLQNVGVIKFKSMKDILSGNFKILDEPIITADNVKTFNRHVNPSVTEGPDGRYYASIKARKNDDGTGGFVHWIMISDAPDKKFKVFSKMLDHTLGAEDPYMWYDKKRKLFYAIVKEFGKKKLAPEFGALALIVSKDAKKWQKAKHSLVTLKHITYKKDKDSLCIGYRVSHTDRPQLVFDDRGNIITLNIASGRLPWLKGVFNIQLRILPVGESKNLQRKLLTKFKK